MNANRNALTKALLVAAAAAVALALLALLAAAFDAAAPQRWHGGGLRVTTMHGHGFRGGPHAGGYALQAAALLAGAAFAAIKLLLIGAGGWMASAAAKRGAGPNVWIGVALAAIGLWLLLPKGLALLAIAGAAFAAWKLTRIGQAAAMQPPIEAAPEALYQGGDVLDRWERTIEREER